MKSILIFFLGAISGSALLLFVVLLQWHATGKLGATISWLPSPQVAESTSLGSIRGMPPTAAPAGDAYPEHAPGNAILIEPEPMEWPPAGLMSPPIATPTESGPAESNTGDSGQLLMPVAGVKAMQLSDTFNQARGGARVHDAIDIMAPKGTAVVAVHDGKVAKLFNSKQGGLTVYQFDTDEKRAFYYAHLDGYAAGVAEGVVLKRGDIVGYVGSTGNASPEAPHLHFAIFMLGPEKKWWQGTAVNPYPLLGGTGKK